MLSWIAGKLGYVRGYRKGMYTSIKHAKDKANEILTKADAVATKTYADALAAAEERCDALLAEAKNKCDILRAEAQQEINKERKDARERAQQLGRETGLRQGQKEGQEAAYRDFVATLAAHLKLITADGGAEIRSDATFSGEQITPRVLGNIYVSSQEFMRSRGRRASNHQVYVICRLKTADGYECHYETATLVKIPRRDRQPGMEYILDRQSYCRAVYDCLQWRNNQTQVQIADQDARIFQACWEELVEPGSDNALIFSAADARRLADTYRQRTTQIFADHGSGDFVGDDPGDRFDLDDPQLLDKPWPVLFDQQPNSQIRRAMQGVGLTWQPDSASDVVHRTVRDMLLVLPTEFVNVSGVGQATLRSIRGKLAEHGLALPGDLPPVKPPRPGNHQRRRGFLFGAE